MEKVTTEDVVNHPVHYADTCSLECIEVMVYKFGKEATANFCRCNAFKYLWRFKNKNGEEDLRKAHWYVNKAKELGWEDMALAELLETVEERING